MNRTNARTVEFDPGTWAPPVETAAELWALAPDGQLCFVQDEACIYVRRGKQWVQATPSRPRPSA
ncbi:MAG: hypothetical protein H6737_07305 [Alphaproteobacteria bacterium]|nr:hypothetical protein [Alphaproteobacteria bacterium]